MKSVRDAQPDNVHPPTLVVTSTTINGKPSEFSRFEELAGKLLKVSKSDLDRERQKD